MFCSDSGDSAVLHLTPTKSIVWYKDNSLINDVTGVNYRVTETGIYHALLTNDDGCVLPSQHRDIVIDDPTPGIRYPDVYAVGNLPLTFTGKAIWR